MAKERKCINSIAQVTVYKKMKNWRQQQTKHEKKWKESLPLHYSFRGLKMQKKKRMEKSKKNFGTNCKIVLGKRRERIYKNSSAIF